LFAPKSRISPTVATVPCGYCRFFSSDRYRSSSLRIAPGDRSALQAPLFPAIAALPLTAKGNSRL
jgi:hypothetical protein